MDDPQQSLICHSSDNDKKEIHWDLDIRKCGAFHNYYGSPGACLFHQHLMSSFLYESVNGSFAP